MKLRRKPVMATLWNLVLVVSLLALSAPQRCSGVDQGSLGLQDVQLLDVNGSLMSISDTVKEDLRLHEKNSEALKDLQSLPELVLMVKEQMNVQNENIESMKKQLSTLQREEALSKENAELKLQLENNGKMVAELEVSKKDLDKKIADNDIKVQVLEKRIMEHQDKEEQLEKTLLQLNNTVAAQKKCGDSSLKWTLNGQEIIRLVQEFSNTKDWGSMKRGLETLLDSSSEPCIQLQLVDYSNGHPLSYVGYYGYTQLASLLLDAGLPVHTADDDADTMLHGAARGSELELVKLLLCRGANVNIRGLFAQTPLMYATRYDQVEVVKFLVNAGADTTVWNKYGRTALDFARYYNSTAVMQYLQQLPH